MLDHVVTSFVLFRCTLSHFGMFWSILPTSSRVSALNAINQRVKHLGWFYLDVAYPNWGGYDPPQWLDGAENLAKTPFWKNPPEAFAPILADGDLPMNQRMLRGYSICRVVGYMGVVLWEAPLGLTYPVEPCWSQNKEAA